MTTLEELWPMFGLRVRCGPLALRAIRDDDLPTVVEVVRGGIHAPDRMPFYFPWTDARGDALAPNTVQYHWRSRAELTPAEWSLVLGVWRDGSFVGIQGCPPRTSRSRAPARPGPGSGSRSRAGAPAR